MKTFVGKDRRGNIRAGNQDPKEMSSRFTNPADYVRIYESELQAIAAESLARGSVETGGELYGLRTHARRAVVLLATLPGPRAIHEREYFEQDLNFFSAGRMRFSRNSLACCFTGTGIPTTPSD